MNKHNITILGAGGHGLSSLQNLFENEDIDFNVFYSTADWGGATGLFGRLLEFDDFALNREIHRRILPTIPFGDPNKLICYFLNKSGNNLNSKNILDFRSNIYEEHLEKIKELRNLLGLETEMVKEFLLYFNKIWNYYAFNQAKVKFRREFCLGYVFLYFLIKDDFDIKILNEKLRGFGALPSNVSFDFASSERQVLVAKDISLERLVGEDKIDKHKSPFLPQSMSLQNPDKSLGQAKLSLVRTLSNSDLVVIPTGSIYNWLAIVNYKTVQNILRRKKIVWITNPFKTKNELHNSNYLSYFHELNIHPLGYGSKQNHPKKSFFPILEQDKQGKYFPEQLTSIILENLYKD
jgi:hypothetical protein